MGQCLDRFQYSGTARHTGNLLCHRAAHLAVQNLCWWLSFEVATTCTRHGSWGETVCSVVTTLDCALYKPSIQSKAEQIVKPTMPLQSAQSSWLPRLLAEALHACHLGDRKLSQSQVSISTTVRILCRQKQMQGRRGEGQTASYSSRDRNLLEPLGISPKWGTLNCTCLREKKIKHTKTPNTTIRHSPT